MDGIHYYVHNGKMCSGTEICQMRVVRLEDLSTTKEEAAEKYRQKLLES